MEIQITDDHAEEYIRGLLAGHDEPVLLEMEDEGRRRGFPIVGRMVGVVLEQLARAIGARRVFEMGSGFGYSAYWFCRAVGDGGEVHLTDGDPENERTALAYLGRGGCGERIRFHVGDAVETFTKTDGMFDIVFCDIDKGGYPAAWRAARDRIRPGGLYICDNTLSWGSAYVPTGEGHPPEWIEAVRDHNRSIAADPAYLSTILPIRDGVLVALRLS